MKKPDESNIETCLAAMRRATEEVEVAKALMARRIIELAEAQCPWEPDDFVQVDHDIEGAAAYLYAKSYRVKSVKSDHSRTNAPTWCILVADPAGNSYGFSSTRNLIPGEPWSAEDEPAARET